MATTHSGPKPFRVNATATPEAVTLDPQRTYIVHHLGVDASGTASSGVVTIGCDGEEGETAADAAPTNHAAGVGAWIIDGMGSIEIGPGIQNLNVRTLAGTIGVLFVPTASWKGLY